MRRFAAAALVDRDVHKDGAGLHIFEILFLEQLRRRAARDQHRADDEIGLLHGAGDALLRGDQRLDPRAEQVVEIFQPLQVDIEDRDVRAHADGDLAGVGADGSSAEDDDLRLRGAGDAGEQYAFAAEGFFKIFRALLHRETAGDLAHRNQQRQRTVLFLERLIGDALDFAA